MIAAVVASKGPKLVIRGDGEGMVCTVRRRTGCFRPLGARGPEINVPHVTVEAAVLLAPNDPHHVGRSNGSFVAAAHPRQAPAR